MLQTHVLYIVHQPLAIFSCFNTASFDHRQDWESAAKIATAFQIGKYEAQAVYNLKKVVHPSVLARLRQAVECRGMGKLLTHELLARDLFNPGYTSGLGPLEQWREECRNKPDNELAPWSKCHVFFATSTIRVNKKNDARGCPVCGCKGYAFLGAQYS